VPSNSSLVAVVTAIVGGLSFLQIPLDMQSRVLSRRASLIALSLLLMCVGTDLAVVKSSRWALVGLPTTMGISTTYLLAWRVSSKALGLGDVLLVIPLTLAVSYVGIEGVLYWQLLAACTGALHAIVMRLWRGQKSIPFGPHLLLAALGVLIVSV